MEKNGQPMIRTPDGGVRPTTSNEQQVLRGEVPTFDTQVPGPTQPRRTKGAQPGNFIGGMDASPVALSGRIVDSSMGPGNPNWAIDPRIYAIETLGRVAQGGQGPNSPRYDYPGGQYDTRQPATVPPDDDDYLRQAMEVPRTPPRTTRDTVGQSETSSTTKPEKKSRGKGVIIATVAATALSVVAGIYYVGSRGNNTEQIAANGQQAAVAADLFEAETAVETSEKEFSLEYAPQGMPVLTIDSEATVSTMWNPNKGAEFDARKAIGVKPGDPGLDLTVSPKVQFRVSVPPYEDGAKDNAIVETTGEEDTLRQIKIDLSKLKVEAIVYPDSIEDTTPVKFFTLPAHVRRQALIDEGLSEKEVSDLAAIYEANKNHAEAQAIGLVIKDTLTNLNLRGEVIKRTEAILRKELGLGDPSKFSVKMEGQDKFGLPDKVVNQYQKAAGVSDQYVRIVISDDYKSIIETEISNDSKNQEKE